jgi:hypothetical protein
MSVAPIPVLILLVRVRLVVFTKILLILPQVLTVGAIFVLIPIVVVLVGAIVDTATVSVVALAVFLAFVFLTSVVLSGGTDRDSRGCEKCGGQGKKSQVSESGFHVVVLLRIKNSNPEPSGPLGGNLSRIDHITKIVFPSASMSGARAALSRRREIVLEHFTEISFRDIDVELLPIELPSPKPRHDQAECP